MSTSYNPTSNNLNSPFETLGENSERKLLGTLKLWLSEHTHAGSVSQEYLRRLSPLPSVLVAFSPPPPCYHLNTNKLPLPTHAQIISHAGVLVTDLSFCLKHFKTIGDTFQEKKVYSSLNIHLMMPHDIHHSLTNKTPVSENLI